VENDEDIVDDEISEVRDCDADKGRFFFFNAAADAEGRDEENEEGTRDFAGLVPSTS